MKTKLLKELILLGVAGFFSVSVSAITITYSYEGGTSARGLYDLNTETGESIFRAPITPGNSRPRLHSFDVRPDDGTVFGVSPTTAGAQEGGLYMLDPNSGGISLVGAPDTFLFSDIAFHPITGTLLGLGFSRTDDGYSLVEIDPLTGDFSEIGATIYSGTGSTALAFDQTGNLYSMFRSSASSTSTLYRLDPLSTALTEIGSTDLINTVQDFVFSGGNLFASDFVGKMFEIDLTDGSATQIASLIDHRQIGGIFEYQGGGIELPEPIAPHYPDPIDSLPDTGSTLALLLLGFFGVIEIRRRIRT